MALSLAVVPVATAPIGTPAHPVTEGSRTHGVQFFSDHPERDPCMLRFDRWCMIDLLYNVAVLSGAGESYPKARRGKSL